VGDVLLARGDIPKAKAQFFRAIEMSPNERHPHQRLGMLFEEEKDFARAIEHCEKGLVGAPANYIGLKVNLGRLYNLHRQYRPSPPSLLLYPSFRRSLPRRAAAVPAGAARHPCAR
jgi:tetratricopeptide (TPR) repeat protein